MSKPELWNRLSELLTIFDLIYRLADSYTISTWEGRFARYVRTRDRDWDC
jgi:hypothetical protein